jgi:hypothetical protein
MINLGFNKILGSYISILFWTDRWYNGCAFSNSYPFLYSIVTEPNIYVASAFKFDSLYCVTEDHQTLNLERSQWLSC